MLEPIFIFFLIAIVEMILLATWNPTYFRIGIPIYKKKYPFNKTAPNPINEEVLNEAFQKTITPSLVFKHIGSEEYAFREKLLQFTLVNYTPIMHGKLTVNESSRDICVIGHINWWIVAFIITGFIFFSGTPTFLPFMFIVLGAIYLFQKNKYDKVGPFVYEWHSRNESKP